MKKFAIICLSSYHKTETSSFSISVLHPCHDFIKWWGQNQQWPWWALFFLSCYVRCTCFVFMVQLSFCPNITVFIQPHTVFCGDISEIWSLFVAVSVLSRYLSSSMLMLYISDRCTCWCPSVCCCTWFIATTTKKTLHLWFVCEILLIRCLVVS